MIYNKPTDPQPTIQPLAIVGLSLRYPDDATSSEAFWQMITKRRCASRKFPSDRLNVDAHHHPDASRQDSISINGAHFISGDVGVFDAGFFSIPAPEAEGMDPQQRLVLEASYHALENAGISLEKAPGSQTCVFTGCSGNDYGTFLAKDPQRGGNYAAFGQAMSMVANRVSWFYNLKGPSANVDTACSNSLIALDLACQSIWSGVSSSGLVVGANLIFAREYTNGLDNLGVFSQDNRCFSFDERANGYSRGEGIGALVIKPVEDAIRDGDTIRAVIRSTRSNQDGRRPGITNPSREAQKGLIEDSYRQAGLDPAATRYFEAHGTGTPTGDPNEMRAIGAVFRSHRSPEDPLYVGSVKSNIGHLEGGSGIAGVIKVVLALEKGIIPPISENFNSLNPKIDDEYLDIKISSTTILPKAGMLTMAVEAVKQVVDPSAVITGFDFKNVKFMAALVVPSDGPGVDTRFFMCPLSDDDQDKHGWYEFSLCSQQKGSWVKNCTGTIQAVIEKAESESIDGGRVARTEIAEKMREFNQMSDRCTAMLSREKFYGSMEAFGCQFGQSFMPIWDITTDQADHLVTNVRTYSSEASTNWHDIHYPSRNIGWTDAVTTASALPGWSEAGSSVHPCSPRSSLGVKRRFEPAEDRLLLRQYSAPA